jgi:esterase
MRGDFHVLALDMRGHGDSQWHAGGSYGGEDYLADLSIFARQSGLERFYLVGESLGGLIAFAFAATNPGAVERLVIVDIGPEMASEGMGDIRQSAHTRPADFADIEEAVRWMRGSNPAAQEPEMRQRLQHNLAPTPEGRLRWKYDPAIDALVQSSGSQAAALLWQLWCAVACPTLVMRGENSALLSPETAQEMESRAANAHLVEIPNAGHAILWDNPEGFQDAAADFLMRPSGA